jgi:UDP-N-acetylmuramate--alanine ligase
MYPLMQLENLKYGYFLGIGGIGMSALARYFNALGIKVSGYDKTPTPLTDALIKEGIAVHFEDKGIAIGLEIKNDAETLVVITPAIPQNHGELQFFKENGYNLLKRAAVLGLITRSLRSFCVAGTHGKTTTSTLLAHLFNTVEQPINAFLGGISSNFGSNLLMDAASATCIVEADEFDRSFLQLSPQVAIITSTEADHLDIYGEAGALIDAFQDFAALIEPEGYLLLHQDIQLKAPCRIIQYGLQKNGEGKDGIFGYNLRVEQRRFVMDVTAFGKKIENVVLGIPGIHNAENALAVIGIGLVEGLSVNQVREALQTFRGVQRRFDVHIEREDFVYIDDYAHHPTAIRLLMESVRMLYPDLPITLIFQPHLYSRTRDFMEDFASSLSLADELILLPIYPARELPIPGISSDVLLAMATAPKKELLAPNECLERILNHSKGVILTVGAGDIDRLVEPLKTNCR